MSVSPPPSAVSAGPAFAVVMGPLNVAPPSSERHTGLALVSDEPMLEGAVIQMVCGLPAVPCVPAGAMLMLGSPKAFECGRITGAEKAFGPETPPPPPPLPPVGDGEGDGMEEMVVTENPDG